MTKTRGIQGDEGEVEDKLPSFVSNTVSSFFSTKTTIGVNERTKREDTISVDDPTFLLNVSHHARL